MQFETEQQEALFETMKESLPNFPPELLYHWLLPFACDLGWPPGPNDDELDQYSRWTAILKHPISFWRLIKWERRQLNPDHLNFNQETHKGLRDLIDTHAYGKSTPLGVIMGASSRSRFYGQARQLLEVGTFAEPPVIMSLGDRDALVDGNHRMSALAWIASDPRSRSVYDEKNGQSAPLRNEHEFWVGAAEAVSDKL